MTPRPDPGSAGSPLAVLRTAIRNCDIHGIPDCSPLLNGCSRVNHNHAALADVERLVEAARNVSYLVWEADEDEVRAAGEFREALAPFEAHPAGGRSAEGGAKEES